MPRVRVVLAILVLLVGGVLAAGCARTDQPSAAGPGDTAVTTPPSTNATPTTPAPTTLAPTSTIPTPAPEPLLVWPWSTSVAVTHSVAVPPVPVLVHMRVGRHPGYDRIVYQFSGPIPSYRVQPVASLAEDGSGTPVWPGSPNLLQIRLEPAQAHTDSGRQSTIGLYKTELIRRHGPWRTLEEVELATLSYIDWFNQRRLHGQIGNLPPAELEATYYRQLGQAAVA
jgi:Integrase core domain